MPGRSRRDGESGSGTPGTPGGTERGLGGAEPGSDCGAEPGPRAPWGSAAGARRFAESPPAPAGRGPARGQRGRWGRAGRFSLVLDNKLNKLALCLDRRNPITGFLYVELPVGVSIYRTVPILLVLLFVFFNLLSRVKVRVVDTVLVGARRMTR